MTVAQIAATHAEATIARDGPQKALATLLQQQGEADEALRIRREE